MNKIQQHFIERQQIRIKINGDISESELRSLQRRIVHLYKTSMGEMLDRIFSELVAPDIHLQIDQLQINAPSIELSNINDLHDIERKIEASFKKVVRKAIQEKLKKSKLKSSNSKDSTVSKWDILESFLLTGHYPSWASIKNQPVDKIMEELLKQSPQKMVRLLVMASKKQPKLIDRLVYQLSPKILEKVVGFLFLKDAKAAIKQLQIIRRRLGLRYEAMRGQKSVDKALFAAALEYVFEQAKKGKTFKYNEKDFVQQLVDSIQSKYKHVDEEDIIYRSDNVHKEHSSSYSDLDVLEYFLLYGSIPYWSTTASPSSLQELFQRLAHKRLVPLQRMVEKNLQNKSFVQRLVMQFSKEQVLQLIEPTSEDNLAFVETLIQEIGAFSKTGSSYSEQKAEHAVLFQTLIFLGSQRGTRLSKVAFIEQLFQDLSPSNSEEMIEGFYFYLQNLSQQSYSLQRNHLLRLLLEISPDLGRKTPTSSKVHDSKTKSLEDKLKAVQKALKNKKLSPEKIMELQAQELLIQQELSSLEALKLSGSFPTEGFKTFDSLVVAKLSIEKRLQIIEKKLFQKIKLKETEEKKLLAEQASSLVQLKELQLSFEKLQKELLSSFEKAKDPETRQNLKNDFDRALAFLRIDQQQLQTKIAELKQALEGTLSNSDKKSLQKEQKVLEKELAKLDEKIDHLEQQVENIRLESEEKAEEKIEESPTANSKLDFLLFFLEYGSIPWWAEAYRDSSLEDIFVEFVENDAEKLRQAFSRIGRNPIVWKRLLHQLKEETLEKLIITLFPSFGGFAVSQAIILDKIYEAQILENLQGISKHYFKWSKVLSTLFISASASFSPSKFVRDVVIALAQEFSLSPKLLLEYMTNLSNNFSDSRLGVFADIIEPLENDPLLLEAEKELIELALQRRKEAEGLILSDEKKHSLLKEFLEKGKLNEDAFKAGYEDAAGIERLVLELLLQQPAALQSILKPLLTKAPIRRRLIVEFSNNTFWELVLLLAPTMMPLSRRYFKDLGMALNDTQLLIEKDVLLSFIADKSDKPFEIRAFLQILIEKMSEATQRQTVAILNEWKRKLYVKGPQLESSLILITMQLEAQQLKNQLEATEDSSLKESLEIQLHELIAEFQHQNQQMVYLLNKEHAESQGLEETIDSLENLVLEIEKTKAEIEELRSQIEENPVGEAALKQILIWRQLAHQEGHLNLLQQNLPFPIRMLSEEQKKIQTRIEELELQLGIGKKSPLQKIEMPTPSFLGQLAEIVDKPEQLDSMLPLAEEPTLTDADLKELQNDFVLNLVNRSIPELKSSWETFIAYKDLFSEDDFEKAKAYLFQRLLRQLQIYLAKALSILNKEQQSLLQTLNSIEDSDAFLRFRRQLLQFELKQNDSVDSLLESYWLEEQQTQLQDFRKYIRQYFIALRQQIEVRSQELENQEKEALRQEIANEKVRLQALKEEEEAMAARLLKGILPSTEEKDSKEPIAKKLAEKEAKKKPLQKIDEPLFVGNAGLVLLWPYFSRLFNALGLLEKNKFISEEGKIKGVHLLQYIANGQTEHPENELVLNKVMCGLPLDTPIPMNVGLSEEELKTADSLLQGALNNWTRMKTMSPDALRGSFLLREGTIKEDVDRWKLKVEKGSFDMLLKTLPWAYTFVRFPWMDKFIAVEWAGQQ